MEYVTFDPKSEYSVLRALLNAGFTVKQSYDAVRALFPCDDDDDLTYEYDPAWEDEYVWVPDNVNHEWDENTDFSAFDSYEPTLAEWRFYRDHFLNRQSNQDRQTFEDAMEWCDAQEAIEDERNHEEERYS